MEDATHPFGPNRIDGIHHSLLRISTPADHLATRRGNRRVTQPIIADAEPRQDRSHLATMDVDTQILDELLVVQAGEDRVDLPSRSICVETFGKADNAHLMYVHQFLQHRHRDHRLSRQPAEAVKIKNLEPSPLRYSQQSIKSDSTKFGPRNSVVRELKGWLNRQPITNSLLATHSLLVSDAFFVLKFGAVAGVRGSYP